MHCQAPSGVTRETLQILRNGRYVYAGCPVLLDRARLANSVRNSMMYSDGRELPSCIASRAEVPPRVVIFEGDSFDAASWALIDDPTCSPAVLDFASDSEPGGGYKGNQQSTQEESLCRRSNLAPGLEALSDKYPIPALGAAYVPGICVFRGNEAEGYPLCPEPIWLGGVIAAALRNVDTGDDSLDPKQAAFVSSKIDGVLAIARHHDHKVLVLGAWGCGAFGNNAPCIAGLFREAINGPHALGLSIVIFALNRKEKLHAFRTVFHDALCVPRSTSAAELPNQDKDNGMVFQALGCELCALMNESSVWEDALAAVNINDANDEDLRANLQTIGRVLVQNILAAGESTLPEYTEELAEVKAATDPATVATSSSEVAGVLTLLESSVKSKIFEFARQNGWLQKRRQ